MPASRRGVQQRLDAVGARNVVLLAYPNRMLRLIVPITTRRGLATASLRVDDPAAFDAAMESLGVAVH